MKILITGSRHYTDYPKLEKILLDYAADAPALTIVQGEAKGADAIAKEVCRRHKFECKGYPAKWGYYGRAAGSRRNQEMIDKEHLPSDPIDLVVAFPLPDSIGTYDMINKAHIAGLPVRIVKFDKPVEPEPVKVTGI